MNWNLFKNNEIKGVEVLKPKDLTILSQRVKQELPKYWTKEEINDKLSTIRKYKNKMLVTFLWMSGIRITEAVSLKKGDIDFKAYLMRVKWLKSRKYLERVVPIHPRLKDLLEVYTAPLNLDDRVFPFTRQRAWQIVRECMQGHPHQLRHSFAVNWIRSGGDVVMLHKILGHSKIQTTMEYLKIVPIDQGKELLKINFD